MATPDDKVDLGHTATLPAGGDSPPPASPRPPTADIESASQDLAELPVVDPETYVFGHYFARGGMGRIAAVRDKRLGRVVAVKELLARDPSLIERFKREIRITARLEHPAIVSIHEAGQWPTGEPFFVMRKVAGKSLKDAIAACGTLDERLGLLASVIAIVDALAYAHQRGIIHRDLKPANVLVGEFGETVVIDWGLAKDLHAGDELDPIAEYAEAASAQVTVAGSLLGTPAYMAPEQARGEVADERSDVYALGAILYTVLAGEPPYDGSTQAEVVGKVLVEQPVHVGERQPEVPGDLQTIVTRAMAREPSDRYPSARELAADLKRFQTGQLVASHRYSRGQLFARWIRRHRGAVSVGLAAVVALIVLGTVSVIGIVGEKDRALAAELRSSARSDALVIAQARAAVEVDPHRALRWLSELPLESTQWPAARSIAADAAARGVPRVLAAAAGDTELALSDDGRWLALAGVDHQLEMLEVATGKRRVIARSKDPITDIAINRDGSTIATASADNTVVVWKADGTKLRTFEGHDGWVVGVELTADGKHVVSTGLDRTTRLWDLEGDGVRVLPMRLRGRDVSRDGRWIAGLDPDSDKVHLWDTTTTTRVLALEGDRFSLSRGGTFAWVEQDRKIQLQTLATGARRTLADVAEPITQLLFTADGSRLVVGTRGGNVEVIEVAADARWSYRAAGPIRGLAMPEAGTWIAAWSSDGPVHLIDVRAREGRILPGSRGSVLPADSDRVITRDAKRRLLEWSVAGGSEALPAHPNARSIAMAPDGTRIAFGGARQTLRVWSLASRETIELAGPTAPIIHATWSPNGALIATLDEDKRVWLWDVAARRGVALAGRAVAMVAFSPDGARVAAPGDDRTIRVWDVATGALQALGCQCEWANWIGFAPDGRLAATASDGTILVWEAGATRPAKLGSSAGIVRDAAFSPDGAWLATGGLDGKVRLWPRTGSPIVLSGHLIWVTAIAFDPSGRTVASGGADRNVRIWDVATGTGRVLGSHGDTILDVRFAPDGASLVSTAMDGTARLWHLGAEASHRVLRGHAGAVWSATVFPDGKRVATVGHDGVVRIWADDLPHDPISLRAWLGAATR